LSRTNTGGDAGWLPLTTAVALSGNVGPGVGARGAFSAATPLAKDGGGATEAWSLLLAAVSLIGADWGAAGAGLPLPAGAPPTDAICEPKVFSADSAAVNESVSSHAQNATAQMPTVTNAPAATTAFRNLMRPLAESGPVVAMEILVEQ
jgi:hypothetical protein